MYCPSCGVENGHESVRFCRACGADLRSISRAMTRSLPVKIATTVDAYLENRYQQNMRSGVVNLLAFIALLIVGSGYLFFGWTRTGVLLLIFSALSFLFGVWDIWIYRRNLPPVANQPMIPTHQTNELNLDKSELTPPSITEATTKHLRAR